MMVRIDWLRDMGTAFGKAVLAIALEIWVNLEGKRRMGRLDWADGGERNGWEGCGGGKETEGRLGKDGLGKSEEKIFNWKRQSIKRKF